MAGVRNNSWVQLALAHMSATDASSEVNTRPVKSTLAINTFKHSETNHVFNLSDYVVTHFLKIMSRMMLPNMDPTHELSQGLKWGKRIPSASELSKR